jgi:hypothetical protein
MTAFAIATGKTREWIENALKGLVGEPGGPGALEALSDSAAVHDTDLEKVLVNVEDGIPLGIFRKNLPKLRGPQALSGSAPAGDGTTSFAILPSVPDDKSFLELLKVGGVLKPSTTEVVSAVKAALASKLGLFGLPEVIVARMEQFAEEQEEPVGENFFKLRKLIVKRKYGEVLEAFDVDAKFVSDTRKKKFLDRLDTHLWAEVFAFQAMLKNWQESWMSGMANPALLMTALVSGHLGGGVSSMPPGMMQPPDTSPVRDAAEGVINRINQVFAGLGVPVARALAYDATRIREILEEPSLPMAIGAANREQMLKMLNVTVTSDIVRLERSLAGFILALMELPGIPSGQQELVYLGAMFQLGATIPWDKLPDGSGRSASLRSRHPQDRL